MIALGERGITRTVGNDNQSNQPAQRLRLTFSKGGVTRYISHLDLARALERALSRASLPMAYSQGFNRRPRLSLAAALPLGYTSEAEIADVWLVEPVPPDQFLAQLVPSMPPGIKADSVTEVPLAAPSLQQQMIESVYTVRFIEKVDETVLKAAVESIKGAGTVIQERKRSKGKRPQSVDLRPLILDMDVTVDEGGDPILHLRLVQTATQTGRPDDVLTALGFDPLDARVHRVALRFAEPD